MAVAVATLGWLPFLTRPLGPDEGGFLMVGGAWHDGASLYGPYWVDRPPVLVAVFGLADALGGTVPLRLLGALATALVVVLAGVLGRAAAPERRSAPLLTAGAAAALVATPLFGGTVVDGEVLGLPFVLAGVTAYVASAASRSTRRGLALALVAGVCGALAVLVKQSLVDVGVVAAVLLVTSRQARRRFPAFLASAVVTVVVVAGLAALRGTSPAGLWDAVVTFRFEAGRVLAADDGSAPRRARELALALVASGLPLLALALGWRGRGRPSVQGPWTAPDLRVAAYVLLAVEVVVVVLGGNFWLHYLMGLVPGVVLLAAAFAQRPAPVTRSTAAAYAVTGLSSVLVLAWVVVHPIARPELAAADYLEAHAAPDDTAVVVFGAANVLRETGLDSPYPFLWSLPARVRDPDLTDLVGLVGSARRPDWVVVAYGALGTWGMDRDALRSALDDGYDEVATVERFTVYRAADGSDAG